MAMAGTTTGRESGAMTGDEKMVIFASSLGTVFEWYDFYLYGWTAAQIGAALATLSGIRGGRPTLLAKVQKGLGLDTLSIGSAQGGAGDAQNSSPTIEAGRYITDRLFVVGKGTKGAFQLDVDVDLTKHLKLETRLGNGTATAQGTTPENDPGSSLGIAYQWEY